MVRLRLKRMGRRHRPFFRLHAVEKRTPRDGRIIEQLGWYDPIARDPEKQLHLDDERIKHWLNKGAQPSDTVKDILAKRNLIDAEAWKATRAKRVAGKIAAAAKAGAAAPEAGAEGGSAG